MLAALVICGSLDGGSLTFELVRLRDVEVADLDHDGDIDIVARNQSLFGYDNGNRLHFFRQDAPAHWHHFSLEIPPW